MVEEIRSDSHGHLHRDFSHYTYSNTETLSFCINAFRLYSRETEKQCSGPHKEGGCSGNRHIATGAEWAGWGGVSKSPAHTETHRHLRSKKKNWGTGEAVRERKKPVSHLSEDGV